MTGSNQKNTGTRPKTNFNSLNDEGRRELSSAEGQISPDVLALLRDHETVRANLWLLRSRLGEQQQQEEVVEMNARSQLDELEHRKRDIETSYHTLYSGHLARSSAETRSQEIQGLQSRLKELQDMVRQLEAQPGHYRSTSSTVSEATLRNAPLTPATQSASSNGALSSGGQSVASIRQRTASTTVDARPIKIESDCESMERSLALLTAQYEKNSRSSINSQCEEEPDLCQLPPSMSLINYWSTNAAAAMSPAATRSEGIRSEVQDSLDVSGSRQLQNGADKNRRLHHQICQQEEALHRELREKREQLEHLMKKNVASSNNANDAEQVEAINKTDFFRQSRVMLDHSKDNIRVRRLSPPPSATTSHPPLLAAPLSTLERNRGSSGPIDYPGQETSSSSCLQEQVNSLRGQLERLQASIDSTSTGGVQIAADHQLHQLTLSLNQIYQVLWGFQRDISRLQEKIASMESPSRRRGGGTHRQPGADSDTSDLSPIADSWRTRNVIWPGNVPLPGDWAGGAADQQPFPPAWHLPQQDQPAPHHPHFSPYPSREIWNTLQNSPGFNSLGTGIYTGGDNQQRNLISETDSGVSSGALNNQVSPGLRANNFYDNFRSYSRQNQFTMPAMQAAASAGRGALPRIAAEPLPANNTATGVNRTRKKYKINREQNRDPTIAVAAAAAPSAAGGALGGSRKRPQTNTTNLEGLTDIRTAAALGDEAVNVYATTPPPHTSLDNITKNIYSQVEALISQHERAPEFLSQLLENLTLLGAPPPSAPPPPPPIRSSARREENARHQRNMVTSNSSNLNLDTYTTSSSQEEDEHDPLRPLHRSSRSKLSSKRLPPTPQYTGAASEQAMEQDSSDNNGAASFHNILSPSTRNSLANTNTTPHNNSTFSSPPPPTSSSSRRNSHNQQQIGKTGHQQQQPLSPPLPSFPVPKNQQINQIGRERDPRRMPGWQERLLPRNMQQSEQQQQHVDGDGFINIQLELPPEAEEIEPLARNRIERDRLSFRQSLSDLAEAELAEADQVLPSLEQYAEHQYQAAAAAPSPEELRQHQHQHDQPHPPQHDNHVHPVRDMDSPLRALNQPGFPIMVGLDRVPIRLASSHGVSYDARRQAEEDGLAASLVEEVLASSPELANSSAADLPPEP